MYIVYLTCHRRAVFSRLAKGDPPPPEPPHNKTSELQYRHLGEGKGGEEKGRNKGRNRGRNRGREEKTRNRGRYIVERTEGREENAFCQCYKRSEC